MANPRLVALRDEFTKVRSAIEQIEGKATAEKRDLTDAEQAEVDTLYTRAEQIKPDVEQLAERERSIGATADILARLGAAKPEPEPVKTRSLVVPEDHPTPGAYFSAYFRAYGPDATDDDREHYRTVADMLLSDVPGLLPKVAVGDLINMIDATRPLFSSFTGRPMPAAGQVFMRPRVTQHVAVAEQGWTGPVGASGATGPSGPTGNEKIELVSREMKIETDDVTKRTFGGTLDLSQQTLDWTSPDALDLVISDFGDVYAEMTELAASEFFATVNGSNTSTLAVDTVEHTLQSFANAAVDVYGQCKRMPDTIWLSLNNWALYSSMVNSYDELVFPGLGAGQINLSTNQFSGTPLGLRVVVGPSLADDTLVMGVRRLVESYEQRRGLLSAVKPTILGYDLSYFGYLAFWGREEGFTSLEAAG